MLTIGSALFALTFLYRFFDASKLINDHFMHVVWGRQVLWGRSPVRDMVGLGLPLQAAISAWAESLVGYRLLSEALVISTAFAAGAALTFVLARRVSASTPIAVTAALLEIAATPRTYSYPKILAYAVGLLALWSYIAEPSRRTAAALSGAIVFAFFLRHDHGLYLAVITTATLALRHWGAWRLLHRRTAMVAGISMAAVAPYLLHVQASGGLLPFVENLQQYAEREFQGDPPVWPRWPLASRESVVKPLSDADLTAPIKIRWSRTSSIESRRAVAARYGVQVPRDGSLESGAFVLVDVRRSNVLRLLRDPIVEDTAGIDRATGAITLPGLRIGRLRLLAGIDSDAAAAALLFYVFVAVIAATAVVLLMTFRRVPPKRHPEYLQVTAALLVAIVTVAALVRDPLAARVPDAIVAPVILGSWLAARWLRRSAGGWQGRVVGVGALVALLVVARSVLVVGSVVTRIEETRVNRALLQTLTVSPPFDGWQAAGTAKYRIVRYVRACTEPSDPLLVLWFAPEFYYYADRPFAGRFGFYIKGYWSSDEEQRRNIDALRRDRPPLAIIEAGREQVDLPSHPAVLAYLNDSYHLIGEVTTNADTVLRVFARNDRPATGVDEGSGWPCYRQLAPPDTSAAG